MSQHLTDHQIDSYIRHRLPAADLLSLTDHLAECAACQQLAQRSLEGDLTFDALRSAVLLDANDGSAIHPIPESMAAYIDGMLSGEDLQALRDHLTRCDHCSVTAEDLLRFSDDVAPALDRRHTPAAPEMPERWWRWSPAFAMQWAFVVILVVGAGWLLSRRSAPETTPAPQIAQTNPAPAPSPEPPQIAGDEGIAIMDGNARISVDKQGRLSGADRLPESWQRMLKDALLSRRLETSPLLASLNRAPSALKSGSDSQDAFSVIAPVGTVSEAARPTFRWAALEENAAYSVEVYDEAFDAVATSPRLSSHEWTPTKPLQRGQTYSWQVRAFTNGEVLLTPRPPAPQAKFRVLDSETAKELDEARRADSHLLLALLSARAGLVEESEKELRLLQKQNPDAAVVRELLNQLPSPTSTNPAQ